MGSGNRKRYSSRERERGQATLELALLVPALLVLLFGAADLSVQAVTARQTQSAAQSAATELAAVMDSRAQMGLPQVGDDDAASYIAASYPGLYGDGSGVDVRVECTTTATGYRHKSYRDAEPLPDVRDSVAEAGSVTVTVDVDRDYITPMAPLMGIIGGKAENGYSAHGRFTAPYDMTGGSW